MAILVAIDGPAGAGKSTVASLLAEALHLTKVDTGALYRAVALAAQRGGVPWDDGPALAALLEGISIGQRGGRTTLGEEDVSEALREPTISRGASIVSAHPEVRQGLLELQRRLAVCQEEGAVLEGRDIATVVLPHAPFKFFVTADLAVRAERRRRELAQRGEERDLDQIMEEMAARDRRDEERAVAPLRPAPDSVIVDTSEATPQEVVKRLVEEIQRGRPPRD